LKFFKKKIEIIPFEDYHVDKSLLNTRTDADFVIPDYETMIIELCDFMKNHKNSLYKRYNLP
jgi:dTDP-4-dehydrorhamnose reductase